MITENHRMAISEGMKKFFENGGTNGRLGKSNGEFQRKRVSETHKGIPLSNEHRKKISLSKIGVKLSEGHVQNLRLARKKDRVKFFKGTPNEYKYLHAWLKKNMLKVDCKFCGSTKKLQYANICGNYSMEISNFMVLCMPCHIAYDWGRQREILKK